MIKLEIRCEDFQQAGKIINILVDYFGLTINDQMKIFSLVIEEAEKDDSDNERD